MPVEEGLLTERSVLDLRAAPGLDSGGLDEVDGDSGDEFDDNLSTILSIRPLTSNDNNNNRIPGLKKIPRRKVSSNQPRPSSSLSFQGSSDDLTLNSQPVPTVSRSRRGMFMLDSSMPSPTVLPEILPSREPRRSSSNYKTRKLGALESSGRSPPGSARSLLFQMPNKSVPANLAQLDVEPPPTGRALSLVSIDDQLRLEEEAAERNSDVQSELGSRQRRQSVGERRKAFSRQSRGSFRRSVDSEQAMRGSSSEQLNLLSPGGPISKAGSSDSLNQEFFGPPRVERMTPHQLIPPIGESQQESLVPELEKLVKDEHLKDVLKAVSTPADFSPEDPDDVFQKILSQNQPSAENINDEPSSSKTPLEKNEGTSVKPTFEPTKKFGKLPGAFKPKVTPQKEETKDEKQVKFKKSQEERKTVQNSVKTPEVKEKASEAKEKRPERDVSKSASNVVIDKEETEKEKVQKEVANNLSKAKSRVKEKQETNPPKANNKLTNVARPKAALLKGSKMNSKPENTKSKTDKPDRQNTQILTSISQKVTKAKIELDNAASSDTSTRINKPGFKAAPVLKTGLKSGQQSKPKTPQESPLDPPGTANQNVITFRFDGASKIPDDEKTIPSQSPVNPDVKSSSVIQESAKTTEQPEVPTNEMTYQKQPLEPKKSLEEPILSRSGNSEHHGPLIKNAMDSIVRSENTDIAYRPEYTPPQPPVRPEQSRNNRRGSLGKPISKPPPKSSSQGKKPPNAKPVSQKGKKPTKEKQERLSPRNEEDVIPNDVKGVEREKSNVAAIYKDADPDSTVVIGGKNWSIAVPVSGQIKEESVLTTEVEEEPEVQMDAEPVEESATDRTGGSHESFSTNGGSYDSHQHLQKLLGNVLVKHKTDIEEEGEEFQLDDDDVSEPETLVDRRDQEFLDDIEDMIEDDEELKRPLTGDPFREIRPRTGQPMEKEHTDQPVDREHSDDVMSLSSLVDNNVNAGKEVFLNDREIDVIQEESWNSLATSISAYSHGDDSMSSDDPPQTPLVQAERRPENFQFAFRRGSREDSRLVYWKKGNKLGHGAFGTVWQGLTSTGQLIAVKQIPVMLHDRNQTEEEHALLQEEVNMLKALKHRNIVTYIGTTIDDSMLNIFMEYIPGGTIAGLLKTYGAFEERMIAKYTLQLVEAVAYLHSNNVVHRDIKGSNLMLMHTGTIKLIDFGCAKKMAMNLTMTRMLKSMKGTPYWMSPEVITETGHGPKSDVWSVGCTVFEMASGRPPWSDMVPMAAVFAIGSSDKEVPRLATGHSAPLVGFVSSCMVRDVDQRPDATQLLDHPFLTSMKERRERKLSRQTSQSVPPD